MFVRLFDWLYRRWLASPCLQCGERHAEHFNTGKPGQMLCPRQPLRRP